MSRELLKECLDALEYELPIIEDFGSQEQLTMHHNAIAKIYAEFQRTKHANPNIGMTCIEQSVKSFMINKQCLELKLLRLRKNLRN